MASQASLNYVTDVYAALSLNPDAAEIEALAGQIDEGGNPFTVAGVPFEEYWPDASQVAFSYRAAFGRNPLYDGFEYWYDQYLKPVEVGGFGKDPMTLSSAFYESVEFAAVTTGEVDATTEDVTAMEEQAYVEALFENVLGREGNPEGIAFWTNALNARQNDLIDGSEDPEVINAAKQEARTELLLTFTNSPENTNPESDVNISYDPIQTFLVYAGFVGREPTEDEYAAATHDPADPNPTDKINQAMDTSEDWQGSLSPLPPYVTVDDSQVPEGGTAVFTIHLWAIEADQDYSFNYNVRGDDSVFDPATVPADFNPPTSGSVTISQGEGTAEVEIGIALDDIVEPLEGFVLDVLNTDNELVATSSVVAIEDMTSEQGKTFELTTNIDGPPAFDGTANDDTYLSNNDTLNAGDNLDGKEGTDTLKYASSSAGAVNEAGFTATSIENVEVTSDAVGGTTFDVTGVIDVEKITNTNSSNDVTFTGADSIFDLVLDDVSAGDTNVVFDAAAVKGADDAMNITLNGNQTVGGDAIGSLNANGIETFNVTTEGGASMLTGLNSDSLTTLNVAGDQDLSVTDILDGATTINAAQTDNVFTGDLSVVVDSGANDVVVTGGTGDDTADFSAGFDSGDGFDGGDGTDTIILNNLDQLSDSVKNIEVIRVEDPVSGTHSAGDLDDSVETLILGGGIDGDLELTDLPEGLNVVIYGTSADGFDITLDGGSEIGLELHDGGVFGTLDVGENTETFNLSLNSDYVFDTITDGSLTTLNITNLVGHEGNLTVTNPSEALTNLMTIDGSTSSGDLDIKVLGQYSGESMTITTGTGDDNVGGSDQDDAIDAGSGDDTLFGGMGADDLTGGDGEDVFVYTNQDQSPFDSEGFDTITDFDVSDDVVSIEGSLALLYPTITYVGDQDDFADATAAVTAGSGTLQAVIDKEKGRLWFDVNDDGTLNQNDLVIALPGADYENFSDDNIGATGFAFTLTAGDDTYPGKLDNSGDDTLFGPQDGGQPSLNDGDILDGGAGNNTIIVEGLGNEILEDADLENFQNFILQDGEDKGGNSLGLKTQTEDLDILVGGLSKFDVFSGEGNDVIDASAVTTKGMSIIDAGEGDNTVTTGDLYNGSYVGVLYGDGNNTITTGDLNDSDAGVYEGDGDNTITTGDLNNGSAAGVYEGDGDNTITTGDVSNASEVGVYYGNGDNTVTTGDVDGSKVGVYYGNGDNTVTTGDVSNGSFVAVFKDPGKGDNTITTGDVDSSLVGLLYGNGDNTITTGDVDSSFVGLGYGTGDNTVITGDVNDSDVGVYKGSGDNYIKTGNVTGISEIGVNGAHTGDNTIITGDVDATGAVNGGAGDDTITTGDLEGTINAGAGYDYVRTTGGDSTLIDGGAGSDLIFAGGGNDTIVGGTEADLLFGGEGKDTLTGGGAAGEGNGFGFMLGDTFNPGDNMFDTITDFDTGNTNTDDQIFLFDESLRDVDDLLDIDPEDFLTDLVLGNANSNGLTGIDATPKITDGIVDNTTFTATEQDSLAARINAVAAAITADSNGGDLLGVVAVFADSTNTDSYLFISDGVEGLSDDDVLVELTGINSLVTAEISVDGGLQLS